ncbi:YkgJ family cysteine cluster protein [Thermodesulfatator autotrophicus]|uniref:Fe-S oxidoreductase n=1 Tax=Thermodesulfatator autotrophicus TaxID=1795632 RepID=A0A177E5T4_9BACT|nr:YkgJ family cysteine cluster protein [Thermodesulfatator autotrophicus]OAG27076.1 Fe-S oxidoreductase [Thermodesulfatator autotrophicus]
MSEKIFECKRCGFCCQGESTVSLSPEEQQRIASFLGLSLKDFLKTYTVSRGSRVEMKIVNGHCIFYDEEQRLCKIHPVKPFHCRRWPLHPSIFKDKENFEIIRASCPGFNETATWEDVKSLLSYKKFT